MKRTLLLLALFAVPAGAADIDVVRRNFIDFYTAAKAERSSEVMQGALGQLEHAARTVTAPGFLLSDGSWSDINYSETPTGSWSPWEHMKRLTVMVKAYHTAGQLLYRDRQLLGQIEASMRYVLEFYGPADLPAGNWWFWTMGIPLDLGPQLVLMRGEITEGTFNDLVFALNLRIGNSPASRGIVGPVPTGENLVWSAFTHLCLALSKDDPVRLDKVRDAMASVTLPSNGEGIKRDGSFHQHGAQLYTGGYGGSFANDVSKYALITRGTSYALPAQSLAAFSDYMADGIAWAFYGKYFDVSVIGREVARRSTTGYNGMAALLQASQFESARAPEIRAAARRMLAVWDWGFPTELAGLAVVLQRSSFLAAWPSGHRHYFASDYTVHRRPGWFASVKMFSTRTKSGESTNRENLRGSRQSDGRFYLSIRGDEYFGRDVWPSLDWTRLPGVTVEQHPTTADDTYGYGSRAFAGGTGDGAHGVSAMEVAPLNSTLNARKSWFFFGDAIVFLTNSISAMTGNRVETIVNQWPLANPGAPLTHEGNWAHADGVGYLFPSGGDLRASRDTRTGTWASLGGSSDATPYTTTFLTMWFDHGVMPHGASAEYVIVPDISATAMRQWAASQPLTILANTPAVSAVRDNRSGARGVVFWAAGSFDGIESDGPAVVYLADAGDGVKLSIADPTSGTGTLRVTIPGRYKGPNATLTAGRGTTIAVPRTGGQTTTVALEPTVPNRRRAVR
ncbi:MAG TPA: polysaccharide lyase family 8 super-sandwich domain-containing protein [Thermoanaerobaculia bacterium]|nr:polysaccharide lyase family 8 super-sandwich domain-containing protein [Thermoanaerobaculia bacterium]